MRSYGSRILHPSRNTTGPPSKERASDILTSPVGQSHGDFYKLEEGPWELDNRSLNGDRTSRRVHEQETPYSGTNG